jgi:hypothetical protein
MLQKGLDIILDYLHKILVGCIAYGFIPQNWKTSKVIFIPKPGKSTYTDAKSFRPISLQSCLLKVLERLIDHHIRYTDGLEVSVNQHAYLSGRSTDTALHHLISKIEKALSQKQSALCTFLDIDGAFNNTTIESVCKAAIEHHINPTIVKWIKQLLTNRIAYTTISGENFEITVNRGCPQGGVLSPLLWTIVVDSLLRMLNEAGVYVQGFADDIVITILGFDHDIIANLMDQTLRRVEIWCENNSLSVNPSKTELILSTRKRNNRIPTDSVKLFGENQKLVTQVGYVGVINDCKLNWNSHI